MTSRKTPASTGILGANPKSAARSRVPVLTSIQATRRKSAGMITPWLTIWSTAPCWPIALRLKMPSTMKPMWLTLE